jgi:hypothetical protein
VFDFQFVLSCVGRGLCDGLITHPKESYQVSKYIKKPPFCKVAKVLSRTLEPRSMIFKDSILPETFSLQSSGESYRKGNNTLN